MVTPNHRWFRYSLRTLFIVVTVAGIWLFPKLKWIMDRNAAHAWIGTQAEYWDDMPVSQCAQPGKDAPWQLRMFGESGVKVISVVAYPSAADAKQQELERLFPEAHVLVMTPGPGYAGKHAVK